MSVLTQDLWPDLGQPSALAPVTILRAQATQLGRKTANVLEGRVETLSARSGEVMHVFFVVAADLNGLAYPLFQVRHDPIEIYPCYLGRGGDGFRSRDGGLGVIAEAASESEFVEALREWLNSETVRQVLDSLLAQSAGTPTVSDELTPVA